ncbi:diguanylate cyclase domain-containing protein [Shewanella maritima]|uniref:diguanylate cyclase domain-containing protein n=1 Tax=Shewanella maritima TaxID=2520507 RepID=UPI003735C82E
MTLSKRLKLTVLFSTLLGLVIASTLWQAHRYQQIIYTQLEHSMLLQMSIDSLRAQLWLHQKYSDNLSLEAINIRQADLATALMKSIDWSERQQQHLKNLNRLNTNIRALINTQISTNAFQANSGLSTSAADLLQSKYNILIEEMSGEMSRLHQQTISQARYTQHMLIIVSGSILGMLTTLVIAWSFTSLTRFRSGFFSLKQGMKALAKGDLDSQITVNKTDEFSKLAQDFNQMKISLNKITIRKEALKSEVKKQTQVLTEQQAQLTFLAEHDELTGIFNRRAFIKQIDHAIARDMRSNDGAALLFIDLDKFKIINDTHGHKVGDLVIEAIAKRLSSATRTTDVVGRLGGDEFVIWLDVINSNVDVELKVHHILEVIKQPIHVNNLTLFVGASIGISQFPKDGGDSASLIIAADTAMYQAKELNGREFFYFQH